MTCHEFQKWLLVRDYATPPDNTSAQSHMQDCSSCHNIYKLDEGLEVIVRENLIDQDLPDGLMIKIDTGIDSAVSRNSVVLPFILKRIAPALAVAALVALVFNFYNSPQAPASGFQSLEHVASLALSDHLRDESMVFEGEDVNEVATWFADIIDYDLAVPDILSRGFVLAGGRYCKLGPCQAVQLMYESADGRATLFIFPASELTFKVKEGVSYTLKIGASNIELWQKGDQMHVFVV